MLAAALCAPLLAFREHAAHGAGLRADGALVASRTLTFELAAPEHPGAAYALGLALSDRPGIPTPVGTVALAHDALLDASLALGPTTDLWGVLDGTGSAALELFVPAWPELYGLEVHAAFGVFEPTGGALAAVSNTIARRVRAVEPAYDFAEVDGVLAGFSDGWAFNDGVAFVFVQNGAIRHASAFGDLALDTRVPYASATKWFTGAALARLADGGAVDLDDPLAHWLPSFAGEKGAITLRQAFAHTSGLPAQAACLGDGGTTLQACAAEIGAGPLVAVPGSAFAYGGASMQCVGAAIEVVTGMPYGAWLAESLLEPLGAHGFALDGFGPTANPRVAGGGKGTVLDYAPLLELLLDGGAVDGRRLVSTDLLWELVADQTDGAVYEDDPLAGSVGYALGAWVEREDGDGRATLLSSPGAFGAYPFVDLERGYGAFVLLRRTTADGVAIVEAIRPLLEGIAEQG